MDLKSQVSSQETSKRLKELGVKQQQSFFCWWQPNKESSDSILLYEKQCSTPEFMSQFISAFTVAELGEMLNIEFPSGMKIGDESYMHLELKFSLKSVNLVHYFDAGFATNKKVIFSSKDSNEANARAKMLIYLIENKLIEVPDVIKFLSYAGG